MGRDLVTHPLAAVSFYASNRDDALASGAPARHFPVHESNNDSAAYSATWLEQLPCSPCGTRLLSSSALVRRLFEQGTKNSLQWRHLHDEGELMAGATTPAYRQALSSSWSLTIQNKNKSRRRTFCVEVGRKKMPDPEEDPAGSSAQKSAFRPVDSGQFQIDTLILQASLR